MTDQEIIDIVVKRFSENEKPKAIYLFGSQARGNQSKDSDIDLLIETDTSDSLSERYTRYRRLLRGLKKPFDLLIYNSKEIEEKKKDKYSVVSKAMAEGIKIYGA